MSQPKNPFILGHKIERPYFCDRVDEQRQLTSAVVNGRNIVLIAPRRMGKSSLAYISLKDTDDVQKDFLTIFVDILQTGSLREFTYLLGKTVYNTLTTKSEGWMRKFITTLKSLKGSFGFDPLSGTPTFDIQLGDIRYPEFTIDEIFDFLEHSERPIIIVIDEFQQVTKYPEKNTEALLRSHIQKLSNVSFVFAGSEQTLLREMFVSSKRPFYNSAEIMHLGPIAENVYVEFATQMFADRNRRIDSEGIKWIFRLFEGNTFYVQRAMNGAFADTEESGYCELRHVKQAVKEMLAANEVIYREILSNVSVAQKDVLYAVASAHNVSNPFDTEFIRHYSLKSASAVQSALRILMKSGYVTKMVEKDGKGVYSLTDPLFRIFINSLYSTPEI